MSKAKRVAGGFLGEVMAALDEIAADPKVQAYMDATIDAPTPTEAELRAMLKANPGIVPD